jgi:hypothetical protein
MAQVKIKREPKAEIGKVIECGDLVLIDEIPYLAVWANGTSRIDGFELLLINLADGNRWLDKFLPEYSTEEQLISYINDPFAVELIKNHEFEIEVNINEYRR